MTGKELDLYIEQTERKVNELLENFPELESSLADKEAQLRMVRTFTKDYTSDKAEKLVPPNLEVYAVKVLKNVLSLSHEPTHIDYSPMYQHIAKYNLTISRVCEVLGISNNTRNLISNNKLVHMSVLKKIADFLECEIDKLFVFISEEERIRRLEKFAFHKSPKKGEESINTASILQGLDEGYRVELVKQATRDKNKLTARLEKSLRSGNMPKEIDGDMLIKIRNFLAHGNSAMAYFLLEGLLNDDDQHSLDYPNEEE